jgi:hypothetical protein
MNLAFAATIAVVLLLLVLGVVGSIWIPQRDTHKDFFAGLDLWLGATGLLMYLFLFALLAVLCFFAPVLVREVRSAVQNLSKNASTIENIAKKFSGSTQVVDLVRSALNTVPDSTKAGLLRGLFNAVTRSTRP